MNAPLKFDISALARPEQSGFGAVIEHTDFDILVAKPGFADALVLLLAKHLVVRIDAPPFEAKSLAAIATRLGPPSVNKGPRLPGFDAIIQFDSPGKPDADPQRDRDGAQVLHHDSAGLAEPPCFAIVNTKTIPPTPAWHSWVNMQAVYRDLPAAMKSKINGLRAIHPSYPELVSVGVQRDLKMLPDDLREKGPAHPLVVRNPNTAEPTLYLSVRRDAKIPGMDADESLKLLTELWNIVEASPHRWRSLVRGDDILIWDNIGTVHDRPPFSGRDPRKIWFANLGPAAPQPAFAA
jgi:alpha-ketoglutarate-dependent taurine dioxygenase